MTKQEILKETKAYYQKNSRAVAGKNCLYRDLKTDNRCAVGRCLNFRKVTSSRLDRIQGKKNLDVYEIDKTFKHIGGLEYLLHKPYQGHELDFWADLQNFHDNHNFWNAAGRLTTKGSNEFERLIEKYK